MKKITIAFLYNVRHKYPTPSDPKSQCETDFDDEATINLMLKYLKKCNFNVIPIEADEKAYLKLYKNRKKINLAFNFSEGIHGKTREAQIPAMLEMLQIPYTGSSSLTQNIIFNKAKTKEILIANNIPTPLYQIFHNPDVKLNKNLKFPLIVKPIAQGSSAGITNKSVVYNDKELKTQVSHVIKHFKQEALVETFLKGREFSVAMFGNPLKILSVIEADHSALPSDYKPIDSLEVKWLFEEQGGADHLICPAKIDNKFYKKIENICTKTCEALEILDWCRIDIRCDENNKIYILEVNSPAGLLPPEISTTSYYPLAARKNGINYTSLLKNLIQLSLKRYESEYPNYK